jgi:hypothetical protein
MSGSEQHDRVALVSIDDQVRIGGIVNTDIMSVDFAERQAMLEKAQDVLRRVVQYTEPASTIQRVCDHPAQILGLQKEIADLKSRQFLPPQCDHTEMENHILTLRNKWDETRQRPAAPGTDEDLQQELVDMTRDAQDSGEEARGLKTQLANALMLAARAALAAPQAPEDRGQKFPDSLYFSGSDGT